MSDTEIRPLSASLPTSIDGYDFAAETDRAKRLIADVEIAGHTINRATARATAGEEPGDSESTRNEHRAAVFTTTLDPDSPVLELGWPTSGHYVLDSRGVHLDLVLGVAQRVVDERNPDIQAAVATLGTYGLLMHREINTDDYLRQAPHAAGLHMPQDVATLLNKTVARSYPGSGEWRTFFTNSGTESVEACLKLACMTRYKRFLAAHGEETLARVMEELGIRPFRPLDGEPSRDETVYEDYPFFLVGLESAFHGRTMGSLSITASKKSQKVGFPRLRWVRHIRLNSPAGTLEDLIDARSVNDLLDTPGELKRVIDSGRIPACLFAGLIMEPFQGEGGYLPSTQEFAADMQATCRRHGGLFILDEVQTFARTGTMFFGEQLGVIPDAMAVAKGLFTAAMVRAGSRAPRGAAPRSRRVLHRARRHGAHLRPAPARCRPDRVATRAEAPGLRPRGGDLGNPVALPGRRARQGGAGGDRPAGRDAHRRRRCLARTTAVRAPTHPGPPAP